MAVDVNFPNKNFIVEEATLTSGPKLSDIAARVPVGTTAATVTLPLIGNKIHKINGVVAGFQMDAGNQVQGTYRFPASLDTSVTATISVTCYCTVDNGGPNPCLVSVRALPSGTALSAVTANIPAGSPWSQNLGLATTVQTKDFVLSPAQMATLGAGSRIVVVLEADNDQGRWAVISMDMTYTYTA